MKQLVDTSELLNFAKELLEQGKKTSFTVTGTSMRPFLKSKETSVTLKSVNEINPSRFDVVLYQVKERYLLHRIVKVENDNFIIMGDSLKVKEIINKEDIIGVVIQHEHQGKIILRNSKGYLFKVKLWYFLRCFRRVLLKVFR